MTEKGFLHLREDDISTEFKRRRAALAVKDVCVDLIKGYGVINANFGDEPFLDTPAVKWSEDGKEMMSLELKGEDGEDITEEQLLERSSNVRYGLIRSVNVIYYPRETTENDSQILTAATIELWAGPNSTPTIYDYNGNPLQTHELEALTNDLERYKELAKQGKFEESYIYEPLPE